MKLIQDKVQLEILFDTLLMVIELISYEYMFLRLKSLQKVNLQSRMFLVFQLEKYLDVKVYPQVSQLITIFYTTNGFQ
jgi:hypothetical protein